MTGQENLLHQVLDIFSTILLFREATVRECVLQVLHNRRHFGSQDNFYNYCLSESARRDRQFDAGRVRVDLRLLPDTFIDELIRASTLSLIPMTALTQRPLYLVFN